MSDKSMGTGSLTEVYFNGETLLLEPEVQNNIFPYLNEKRHFSDLLFMKQKPKMRLTTQTQVNWAEDDELVASAAINAAVGGGASPGDPVTVNIDAIGSSPKFLDPFKVGDVLMVGTAPTFIRGRVEAKTPDPTLGNMEYVIRPMNNTEQLDPAGVAAPGNELRWIGTAHADGTFFPTSEIDRILKYTTDTQIFKATYKGYGSEIANRSYYEHEGTRYWWYRGVDKAITKHKMGLSFACLLGHKAVGLVDPNHPEIANYNVFSFNGLENVIETQGGIVNPYTTDFDYAEWRDTEKLIDLVKGPNEYVAHVGINVGHSIDDTLFTKTQQATSFAYFDGDKDLAASFNFTSIRVGTRTFHIRREDALNWPQITANTHYPDMGFMIPAEVYKDASPNMSNSSPEFYDALCVRYKESPLEGNRYFYENMRDLKEINGQDAHEFNMQAEFALQIGMARKFVKINKA